MRLIKYSIIILVIVSVAKPVMVLAEVQKNTNAADLYEKAYASAERISDSEKRDIKSIRITGWDKNYKKISALIKKNKKALSLFTTATKRTECDFSENRNASQYSRIPHYLYDFSVVRLIIAQARLYEKQGNYTKALDNYFSILRFINHLSQNQQTSFIYASLVRTTYKLVTPALKQIISNGVLSQGQLRQVTSVLIENRDANPGLNGAYATALHSKKKLVESVAGQAKARGMYNDSYYITFFEHFDAISSKFNTAWQASFSENQPDHYIKLKSEFQEKVFRNTEGMTIPWTPMALGQVFPSNVKSPRLHAEIFFSALMTSEEQSITDYYIAQVNIDFLILNASIMSYYIDHNGLPAKLDDLTPGYLEKLPLDPFNDFNAIKFYQDKITSRIYSYGPDRKNDYAKTTYTAKSPDISGDLVMNISVPIRE